MHILNLCI